jgi:ribonuclease G
MSNPENRKVLFDFLKEEMSDDKANTKILSKFGLVKLQDKVRPEVNIKTREEDPNMKMAKLKRQSKSLIKYF